MQSAVSISRALFRIAFRGGTPQRIQYNDRLLLIGLIGFVLASIIVLRYLFNLAFIEIGLALFTFLSGLYLAVALLTRKVTRSRLRISLQSLFLLLGAVQCVLMLFIPLGAFIPWLPVAAGISATIIVLMGSTNILQFAQGGQRGSAALLTLAFAAALGAFYSILRGLLETVFS